jgi:hypothetical protein
MALRMPCPDCRAGECHLCWDLPAGSPCKACDDTGKCSTCRGSREIEISEEAVQADDYPF